VQVALSADALAAVRIRVDTDRDTLHIQTQADRTQATYEAQAARMELERELADLKYRQSLLEYANRKSIALDQAKVELSKTAMTLRVQQDMAADDGKAEEVAEPIVEPKGRAPDGEAFQK